MQTLKKNHWSIKNISSLFGIFAGFISINLFLCFLYFVFMDIYYWNAGLYIGFWSNLNSAIWGGQAFAWANFSYAKLMLLTCTISLFVMCFCYFSFMKSKYIPLITVTLVTTLLLMVFGFMQWKLASASAIIIYIVCAIALISTPAFFATKFLYNKFHLVHKAKINYSK